MTKQIQVEHLLTKIHGIKGGMHAKKKKKKVYLAIIKSSVELYGREIRKSLKKV